MTTLVGIYITTFIFIHQYIAILLILHQYIVICNIVSLVLLNKCICNHWKYRQLAIIPSLATVPVLLDADIIGLNRCICNHWKYRQLAIIPSPALAPVAFRC